MTSVQDSTISPALLAAMNPSQANTKSTAVDAQNRFMTLLVTQMKNQDPLNPLDNAQVTSQLAQLSTVTGIDKMNATLEALNGSYLSSQSLTAAGMIGHGVLVPGKTLGLTDGKAFLGVELTEPADKVDVTIKDSTGKAIRTISVGAHDAGTLPLGWDGKTDAGTDAPNGQYTFEVNATRGGKKITGVSGLSFGEVGSVSTGAQGVKLNVAGVGAVELVDVKQIL